MQFKMSDSIHAYLDILLTPSNPSLSPLQSFRACMNGVADCASSAHASDEYVAFGAALRRHPTAVRTLLAAVPAITPDSPESELHHAYIYVIGLGFIAARSELLCESLVCSDELMTTLSACCEQCRTPPFEFDLFSAYAARLLKFVAASLFYCKARYRVRVVKSGVLKSAMELYAFVLREHTQRGISGCVQDHSASSAFGVALSHALHDFTKSVFGVAHTRSVKV